MVGGKKHVLKSHAVSNDTPAWFHISFIHCNRIANPWYGSKSVIGSYQHPSGKNWKAETTGGEHQRQKSEQASEAPGARGANTVS